MSTPSTSTSSPKITLSGTVVTPCCSAQLGARSAVLSATKRMPAIQVTPKKCGAGWSCAGLRCRVRGGGEVVEQGRQRAGQALAPGGGGAGQAALEGANLGGQGVGDLGALRACRTLHPGDAHRERRGRLPRGAQHLAQAGAGAARQALGLAEPEAELAGQVEPTQAAVDRREGGAAQGALLGGPRPGLAPGRMTRRG